MITPGMAIGMKVRASSIHLPGIWDRTVIHAMIEVRSMTTVAEPAARMMLFRKARVMMG